jgi:acetyl esterase/lipase
LGGIRRLLLRLFLWLPIALVAWSAADSALASVKVANGIVYCRPGGTPLALDLARPEGDGPFPLLVFIHGGGWMYGDRRVYTNEIRTHAAERGFVAVSLDYRLMDPDRKNVAAHPWPAQIDDVRCAIRFLRANAKRYAIDPARVGATGHSAGGQLSLLVGLEEPNRPPDAEWPDASSRVQAVVNQSGPTDLAALARMSPRAGELVTLLLPGPLMTLDARASAASPVFYVNPDAPPVLTIHGEVDDLVPVAQARALDAALRKVGAAHELVVLPGVGHAYDEATARANRTRIYAFFERVLR